MTTFLGHPGSLATSAQGNAADTQTIINFELDNCKELAESDVKDYLEIEENKVNTFDLSDKDIESIYANI